VLETLASGFKNARLKLQGKTRLTEENISEALRDVRISLLEADVEITVVRQFLDRVRERSVGEVVHLKAPKSGHGLQKGAKVSPSDHFIKICHDELVALMGPVESTLELVGHPATIMLVGLQGSGKTTTAGKIAHMLLAEGKKPMLVAADIYRPAAIDQLMTLGRKLDIPVFSIQGMKPVDLCKAAVAQARSVGRDVVIFDTAGRLAIDETLMAELEAIKAATNPDNILFVCDAMIGQDSVRTAAEFDRRVPFTGFVLTKLDGDTRGGAALAIKAVTGKPIKFLGTGEGLDKLEPFRPEGLADRILGFGDVVGLMADFEAVVDKETAEKDAVKMLKGQFTFSDFMKQINMIRKMGSMRSIMEKLPGMGDLMSQLPAEALDDRELGKVEAIIQSMTKQERNDPDVLDDSRIRRIAGGCGRDETDVKELHERFNQMRQMMAGLGNSGLFGGMPGMGGGRAARRRMGGADPAAAMAQMGGMGEPMGGMGGPMGGMGGPMGGMAGMMTGEDSSGRSNEDRVAAAKKKRAARKARKKSRKTKRR
jgi:signal recognition particle subunit SRP54